MIAYDEQMLHIRRLGKRLLRSANCIITFGDASLDLRISAGVASTEGFPSAATDELSGRAEVALYAAKEAGRKCVVEVRPI
jgi:GGDEF domain-containing protein